MAPYTLSIIKDTKVQNELKEQATSGCCTNKIDAISVAFVVVFLTKAGFFYNLLLLLPHQSEFYL
jgi:hypothetical protein